MTDTFTAGSTLTLVHQKVSPRGESSRRYAQLDAHALVSCTFHFVLHYLFLWRLVTARDSILYELATSVRIVKVVISWMCADE